MNAALCARVLWSDQADTSFTANDSTYKSDSNRPRAASGISDDFRVEKPVQSLDLFVVLVA